MTKLINRLKYYGVGFLFGLLFVFFFFQNRGCSWLPENRVKNTLLGKVIALPENERNELKSDGIDDSLFLTLLDDGAILFDESLKDPEVFPKVYVLEKEINGQTIRGQFSIYNDAFITVAEYLQPKEKAERHTHYLGSGKLIHFPLEENLVFFEEQLVDCELGTSQKNLHINVLKALKTNGQINFEESNFMANKAEQQLSFKNNKNEVFTGKAIWFKTKINFTTLDYQGNKADKISCDFK